jgi:C-terminal processing protease CtpA/Prc
VAQSGDAGEKGKFVALVNKNSASCAEIFAAAIQEGAGIPIAGTATYGKGIGQSTWKTPAGGLAIITNLEFLTPKGNSYHKIGISPDYTCESATFQCGFDAIQKFHGKKSKKSVGSLLEAKKFIRQKAVTEGALMPGDDE